MDLIARARAPRATRSPFSATPRSKVDGVDLKIGSFTVRLSERQYIALVQWIMERPDDWRDRLIERMLGA
jgi:hypothetical protein